MLSAYDLTTDQARRNATFEVNQQVVLAGLYQGGFFDKAAFYGGTCLRIFHGLQRFSEDMDFSLLNTDAGFDFTQYFQPIIDEFLAIGREVEITKKDKKNFGKVESAFLKDNTDVYDISFQTEKSIKIKIEVDTAPPLLFSTEQNAARTPFVHDTLLHTARPVCRKDARLGLQGVEKPRERSRLVRLRVVCAQPCATRLHTPKRTHTQVQRLRQEQRGIHGRTDGTTRICRHKPGESGCHAVRKESERT